MIDDEAGANGSNGSGTNFIGASTGGDDGSGPVPVSGASSVSDEDESEGHDDEVMVEVITKQPGTKQLALAPIVTITPIPNHALILGHH